MQIASIRQQLIQRFVQSDTAALDADCLLCAVLSCTRTYLKTWPERELNETQLAELNDMAQRREAGEPVAYILGVREFWSLPLEVSPATLIPRPDTECLVEQALSVLSPKGRGEKALDLDGGYRTRAEIRMSGAECVGTGSGTGGHCAGPSECLAIGISGQFSGQSLVCRIAGTEF